MNVPVEITFRHMPPSPALEATIRQRIAKLEKFSGDIIRCRVVVEAPHIRHQQGNLFHYRVSVSVPGREIVVQRSPDSAHSHEDPYVALRDAFDSTRRQLEDYMRKRRGKVKRHEVPAHGRVIELKPNADYGKLETPDGREIYFHRHSLIDASFEDLTIGTELRFAEEPGEKGAQASTVHIVGKHHPAP